MLVVVVGCFVVVVVSLHKLYHAADHDDNPQTRASPNGRTFGNTDGISLRLYIVSLLLCFVACLCTYVGGGCSCLYLCIQLYNAAIHNNNPWTGASPNGRNLVTLMMVCPCDLT